MNHAASISVDITPHSRTKYFRKHMRLIPACLICLTLTTLLSCGEDERVRKYEAIVDHADRLKIYQEPGPS